MPYQSIVKKSPKNQIFRTQIFTIKIFANLAQFQPTQATQRNRRRAAANQAKIGLSLILGRRGCRASGLILKKLVFFRMQPRKKENFGKLLRDVKFSRRKFQEFQVALNLILGFAPRKNFHEKISKKNFQQFSPALSCCENL